MLQKRILKFKNYSDVITEIESLRKNGYTQSGKWNLGQICRHLSYYQKGALDGFTKMMPWIIRVTIGKLLLKKCSLRLLTKKECKPILNLFFRQSLMIPLQ
ncbi:MAG: DUF1569 domain-containing protein [Leptospiraceae bacterium]|nr:DUF1569 domain-containing protein [Leptospiraceae bacterium]